ncbi:Gamma-glutamylcyclotransferase [Trichoderma simmonsii]|uniref:gamma-glutamylcyclotransferase n=1 Tax=Trichoderma simmonsii TaxID=1491479 RepID=A0A8G0PI40_9HYPO|nr:Gamma-glutamylcyclotransferase [Trichoderma simmonsii]
MSDDIHWYFAYGSNMLEEVFVKRRKIQPRKYEIAAINTHTLCFNVMGVPYTDPAMGGIRLREEQEIPVYGVAYQLTSEDMRRVILTEGGGIAYNTATLTATLQRDGSSISVTTLVARHQVDRSWERLPSRRYMGLLIRGAHEKSLPIEYQERMVSQPTFEPTSSLRFRLGKKIFDSIWQRVARWIEICVHRLKGDDGEVPRWFLKTFDCLLWTMWFHHDYLHSILWGRGDGVCR